jgi:Na+-transporting methylmalonyl-CoA/oxaloacetate decarboxylase gamma subunit
VLARLFLLALVVYAVVVIVQRFREQQRLERDERAPVEQRLAQLDDLLRRELITRTEYDAARLRIIAGEDPD